jgi:hypothetical protein
MEKESFDQLLMQVILMYQSAAMQLMEKVKNPVTDKLERDLEQAKMFIDILDMMKNKMKGNLTDAEENFFTGILHDLHLNYVDEVSKGNKVVEKVESNKS